MEGCNLCISDAQIQLYERKVRHCRTFLVEFRQHCCLFPNILVFPTSRKAHRTDIYRRIAGKQILEPFDKRVVRIDYIQQINGHAQYEINLPCAIRRKRDKGLAW